MGRECCVMRCDTVLVNAMVYDKSCDMLPTFQSKSSKKIVKREQVYFDQFWLYLFKMQKVGLLYDIPQFERPTSRVFGLGVVLKFATFWGLVS